jgi:eukaryotic-like serine/threonine-protein kinase
MNAEPGPINEDDLSSRLLAFDEALASGAPVAVPQAQDPEEMQTRLLRGLACVQRLQQLRPRPRQAAAIETEANLPTRIGRFEIRCQLGRGGFGIVYRAYDPMLCREVALKIPRAEALVDAECLGRFQREARAAAGLDHPNLVPVHEAGQIGPIAYIAFAYCPGHDLATWLKLRSSPVRCLEAARLVRTLARAIHYAHGRGVLHRDLKPGNVLLSPVEPCATPAHDNLWLPEPDAALVPRVTDFGLAKFASDQAQTRTGDLLGTPCYMAPEQTDGRLKQIGPATDVYALGAILYEVITGRAPFCAETAIETLMQVKNIEPVRPSRLRPELPRDLETICLKCLQKEPRKRYPSAEALADDLNRFLTDRPIQARPTSIAEHGLKWARRRPALATSLAALLLVTAFGLAVILWQWHQTQTALDTAQQAQEAQAKEWQRTEVALYHHRVALAHHEWLAGNVGNSAQLLAACPADLRNWEWSYVRRLCNSAQLTCAGHSAHVNAVAVSPNGRHIASAAGLWNSSEPGEVILWDAASGAPLWKGLGNTAPVMNVAFSPDGSRLASVTVDGGRKGGEVTIWETATGKLLRRFPACPPGIFAVAYSPDGSRLATAGADAKVRLWDATSGTELFVLEGHKYNVFSVAFSPDGLLLASAGWSGTAVVWDLASRCAIQCMRGPIDLRSVAFSPDGQHLVAASFDHSVKIWRTESGELERIFWGHRAPALCASYSPDGHSIASTDYSGIVQLWDARTGRITRTVRGHTGAVNGAAFSPDGSRLATASRDRTVCLWDITRDQDVYSLPHGLGAQNVVFDPSGRLLAASGFTKSSGQQEKSVRVWALDKLGSPRYWPGHTGWVRCVAFGRDGKLLASGGTDQTVRLWDVATEKTLAVFEGHTDIVTGLSFANGGKRLASASLDKTVRLWDISAATPVAVMLSHPHRVHDVAFTPDGKRLVAVGDCGMVQIWDAATGAKVAALPGHRDVVLRGVFSPDGRWLATAGADKVIRIWDMTAEPTDGQPASAVHVLSGHMDRVLGLRFSPDGRRLASASMDQTIRIWDVASGDEALTLRGHADTICDVNFSPDGRLLVSAGSRDVKIWDAGASAGLPGK